MSKVNMNDPENADLSRVYAATARDEPPAALDGAVLALARRAAENRMRAGSRHWTRFAAIAATLVVTASLVVLMEREQPQIGALAPPARDTALAPAAKVTTEAVQAAVVAPAEVSQREEKPASSGRLDLPARDQPSEQTGREREQPASRQPVLADTMKAAVPAPAAASNAGAARNLVNPGSAKKDESPDGWLARIAELRKQGRIEEAEESFAEFKKRYPDYPIPAAKGESP